VKKKQEKEDQSVHPSTSPDLTSPHPTRLGSDLERLGRETEEDREAREEVPSLRKERKTNGKYRTRKTRNYSPRHPRWFVYMGISMEILNEP
jgi:hypothetical protein